MEQTLPLYKINILKQEQIHVHFTVFETAQELTKADQLLLKKAQQATADAYAPYSQFHVGAAALLQNGEIVTGSNQENASSPAGLCAERVLLATVSSLYKQVPIDSIAVSYHNKKNENNSKPVSPCGICRQSLLEYQIQQQKPIRLILSGMEGKVFILEDVTTLLPLSFSSADIK